MKCPICYSELNNCVHKFTYDCYKNELKLKEIYLEVLSSLVDGIKEWAGDEDGVPDYMWETFKKACLYSGRYHYIKEEEEE